MSSRAATANRLPLASNRDQASLALPWGTTNPPRRSSWNTQLPASAVRKGRTTLSASEGDRNRSPNRVFSAAVWSNQITSPDNTGTTVSLAADTLYGIPFTIYADTPIDRLAVEITTLDAGSAIRLGLYAESTSQRGEPGARLEDLGTVSSASTGIKTLTISPTRRLGPGRYFFALIASSAVVAFRAHAAAGAAELGWPGGTADFLAASLDTVWRGALAGNDEAAALPNPFPATPTADLATAYPAPVFRSA